MRLLLPLLLLTACENTLKGPIMLDETTNSSDSDNDGVVQCRGTTLAENRCRITSDHDFAAAEPLQTGSRDCAKHAHQEYENFSDQEDV